MEIILTEEERARLLERDMAARESIAKLKLARMWSLGFATGAVVMTIATLAAILSGVLQCG